MARPGQLAMQMLAMDGTQRVLQGARRVPAGVPRPKEIHILFSCNWNRIVEIPDSTAHIRPSRPAGWVPETWRC